MKYGGWARKDGNSLGNMAVNQPTLMMPQCTIDTSGQKAVLNPAGRHDPCVAVRAVPVVKALTAFVIADYLV